MPELEQPEKINNKDVMLLSKLSPAEKKQIESFIRFYNTYAENPEEYIKEKTNLDKMKTMLLESSTNVNEVIKNLNSIIKNIAENLHEIKKTVEEKPLIRTSSFLDKAKQFTAAATAKLSKASFKESSAKASQEQQLGKLPQIAQTRSDETETIYDSDDDEPRSPPPPPPRDLSKGKPDVPPRPRVTTGKQTAAAQSNPTKPELPKGKPSLQQVLAKDPRSASNKPPKPVPRPQDMEEGSPKHNKPGRGRGRSDSV